MQAAMIGCSESVKYFLSKDVDFNKADKDGFTPLKLGAGRGNTEIVRLILEAEAKSGLVNKNPQATENRRGAFALAVGSKHFAVAELLLPQIKTDYYRDLVKAGLVGLAIIFSVGATMAVVAIGLPILSPVGVVVAGGLGWFASKNLVSALQNRSVIKLVESEMAEGRKRLAELKAAPQEGTVKAFVKEKEKVDEEMLKKKDTSPSYDQIPSASTAPVPLDKSAAISRFGLFGDSNQAHKPPIEGKVEDAGPKASE
jgi:hypothetical protein